MKIMVVGAGGREHALIRAIKRNPKVTEIFVLPGNGGIAGDATCVQIAATDLDGMVDFAVKNGVDFAVVAPDDPLVLGAADRLRAAGVQTFGPSKAAARIEGSKVFAKTLMQKYGIPTAACRVFDDPAAALAYVSACPLPAVVKADGLALGKGVRIAATREEAARAVREMMQDKIFGESGSRVVIEEFLEGPEVSVLAFTDGKTLAPMVSSMDHKRALENDQGLNTGGMGAVAPNPFYTPAVAARCMREIFLPTLEALRAEGCPFQGCLYFGLMLTTTGPKVIEYNCRFGDPEAQVVLPLLETDLLTVLGACAAGTLETVDVRFSPGAACCVMVVSGGYPARYEKGKPIGLGGAPGLPGVTLYHSGTAYREGALVTNGGRVLGVTATADTLPRAVDQAMRAAREITFEGAYFRPDIGRRALKQLQGE